MRRREFTIGSIAALSTVIAPPRAQAGEAASQLAQLERDTGGRFGVFAVDTGSGWSLAHREHERFPMCSTFKLLAVSAVLANVDRGHEQLLRQVTYGTSDLLPYAPTTRKYVGRGYMTVGALCEAAIALSDNTAANLLLRELGGPPAVTRYARVLRDPKTRLDRTEPTLNTAIPGDPRDTTTPYWMAHDMHEILLGNALSVPLRERLTHWLVACQTGKELLRAGVPSTWREGDKTGLGGRRNATGANDTRNDIAILWPPRRAPLLVTAYLTSATLAEGERDAALARVGRIVSAALVAA